MADFKYKALNNYGKQVRGIISAEDEDSVLKQLVARGLNVVSINRVKRKTDSPLFALQSIFFRFSLSAFINFLRQFETLIKAGVPLFEALTILIEQEENINFRKILEDVRHGVAEGHSLADCFARHPKVFSEFFVNMIMVGETSGDLAGAIHRVLKFSEEEQEIRSNIINALIYPTILVSAGLLIILLIIVFVLPQFINIFESAQIEMPLPTKILMIISNFLKTKYPFLFVGVVLIYFLLRYFGKTPGGRKFFDYLKINVPVLGPLNKKLVIARLTRVLGNLDESGVPILRALEITQKTVPNVIIAKAMDNIIASVRDGKGLALPMKNSRLFPPMVTAMIAVGEESGFLEKMLLEVAEYYEKETFYTIRRLVSLIEPFMLIIIGVIVAIIAASFLLPMFRMTALLRRR